MFQAVLKQKLVFENPTTLSFEPEWLEVPVLRHKYGYKTDVNSQVGETVYVEHCPAQTINNVVYAESWMVYLCQHKPGVVEINTIAAKKYLKAKRDSKGQLVPDSGVGKRLQDRYNWEMSR